MEFSEYFCCDITPPIEKKEIPMRAVRHTLIAVAVTSTLALAACSSGKDDAATSPSATASSASAGISTPLSADQIGVQMALQGSPALSADGTSVTATVELTNKGKVMLSSAGTKPVNLGAHSADTNGKIINRDLVHAPMPDIAVGGQAAVTIHFPVDQVLGKTVQIVPVQEGVAWFDNLGVKPLVLGPFSSCASPAVAKVCDANGQPLAAAH